MERHLAKKARRSGKHHLKGPAKRTAEDDKHFEADNFRTSRFRAFGSGLRKTH